MVWPSRKNVRKQMAEEDMAMVPKGKKKTWKTSEKLERRCPRIDERKRTPSRRLDRWKGMEKRKRETATTVNKLACIYIRRARKITLYESIC